MSNVSVIMSIDDKLIIEHIDQARNRIFHLAPGVSDGVAEAIKKAWFRMKDSVQIILDTDPEACRLGYGTLKGLETLFETANSLKTKIMHQPGVRICVLVCDEIMLIYTPTPLIIERGGAKTNGVFVGPSSAIGLASIAEMAAREGKPITQSHIEALRKDLEKSPPVNFDLEAKLRLYRERFQFVELKMLNYAMGRRRVPIPSYLMGFADKADIEENLRTQFNLIGREGLEFKRKDKTVINEQSLNKQRKKIEDDFLVQVKGYGPVIEKSLKPDFDKAVLDLRATMDEFRDGIVSALEGQMEKNVAILVDALLPAVEKNPPTRYKKRHGLLIDEKTVRELMTADIRKAFGDAQELVSEMRVDLHYKDVTYDSLQDPEFIKQISGIFPDLETTKEK